MLKKKTGYLADRQLQHVLLKTIFLKLYLRINVHFRRIFSTAPELHYLEKKNQIVISIAYKELTEIRTRFCM